MNKDNLYSFKEEIQDESKKGEKKAVQGKKNAKCQALSSNYLRSNLITYVNLVLIFEGLISFDPYISFPL